MGNELEEKMLFFIQYEWSFLRLNVPFSSVHTAVTTDH